MSEELRQKLYKQVDVNLESLKQLILKAYRNGSISISYSDNSARRDCRDLMRVDILKFSTFDSTEMKYAVYELTNLGKEIAMKLDLERKN